MKENEPSVLARLFKLSSEAWLRAQDATWAAQKAENEAWVVYNCLKVALENEESGNE